MTRHTPLYEGRIVRDPKIMVGKPVIKGTRITVEHILENLAGGLSVDEYVDAYEGVTADDVRAALAYAADHLSPSPAASRAAE